MPQTVWYDPVDYLLSLFSQYHATNSMRPSSGLLSEFCPQIQPIIVADTLLDYHLSSLSHCDATDCMRRSSSLLSELVFFIRCTNSMRRLSRLTSEFVVCIWFHKLYETLFLTISWLCCSNMLLLIVRNALVHYLISFLPPYNATNLMILSCR